jgi:hypothetical protein
VAPATLGETSLPVVSPPLRHFLAASKHLHPSMPARNIGTPTTNSRFRKNENLWTNKSPNCQISQLLFAAPPRPQTPKNLQRATSSKPHIQPLHTKNAPSRKTTFALTPTNNLRPVHYSIPLPDNDLYLPKNDLDFCAYDGAGALFKNAYASLRKLPRESPATTVRYCIPSFHKV